MVRYKTEEDLAILREGGINSAAVLCYLASEWTSEHKPQSIHIVYCHLVEHSPDTFKFVKALVRYARIKFENVTVRIYRNSVIKFFQGENFIPHPVLSPCSDHLKIQLVNSYMEANQIDVDLVLSNVQVNHLPHYH